MKKESMTISVPAFIKNELKTSDNASEILYQIIDENLDRIMGGDVDRALRYRKLMIADQIRRSFAQNTEIVQHASDIQSSINGVLESMKVVDTQYNTQSIALTSLRNEIRALLEEIKTERREYMNELRTGYETLMRELLETYEIEV
jgi:vacuolar-type H+-ATPase subunit I/STV1